MIGKIIRGIKEKTGKNETFNAESVEIAAVEQNGMSCSINVDYYILYT